MDLQDLLVLQVLLETKDKQDHWVLLDPLVQMVVLVHQDLMDNLETWDPRVLVGPRVLVVCLESLDQQDKLVVQGLLVQRELQGRKVQPELLVNLAPLVSRVQQVRQGLKGRQGNQAQLDNKETKGYQDQRDSLAL